jgi:hypothetical protein
MTQVAELLVLVRLLHRKQPDMSEIMGRIAISRATAFRHLDTLRKVFGMEIIAADGRYKIAAWGVFSPTAIDEWTGAEDDLISAQYAGTPVHEIADSLGRTVSAVHNRASKIGAAGKETNRRGWKRHMWSAAEDDIVRQHYAQTGAAIESILPGRTGMAIAVRARHLGVAGRKRGRKVGAPG